MEEFKHVATESLQESSVFYVVVSFNTFVTELLPGPAGVFTKPLIVSLLDMGEGQLH